MIIELRKEGLYCAAGDFYIDPWRPVERAVITHGHADHARPGSAEYFTHTKGVPILRKRLGEGIEVCGLEYGQSKVFSSSRQQAKVSLHSAGHILGSAQVRVEVDGEVWVASGDYKRDHDPSCDPFDVLTCDTFITEATFAMPIYRWPPTSQVAGDIYHWWQDNAQKGLPSVLFCYSLGKAQRILAELTAYTDKTVFLHGAVEKLTDIYRESGVIMLPTKPALIKSSARRPLVNRQDFSEALIIAPPGANGTPWMRRFGKCSTAFCSGWMTIRGARRRRGYDRGFVISDHADWASLIRTIEETRAKNIIATHGQSDVLVSFLRKKGLNAQTLKTAFGDETLEEQGT